MLEKIWQFFGGKSQKETGPRRRVLVIDDNPTDLRLMQRTIEKMGHQALLAENGQQGLEVAAREKPDLILSDCIMPEMDGFEMGKRLKEDPATKDIPLIFLTTVDTPKTIIESFDMGVENYICKPIQPRVVQAVIKKIFVNPKRAA